MLELANITEIKVLKGRHLRELSPSLVKGVIPSHITVTTKVDPDSDGRGCTVLTKAKARLVAGGDRQDRGLYTRSNTTSPTCTIPGLFTHAALACSEGEEVVVTDVTCAYVDASMPKDNPEKLVFLSSPQYLSSLTPQWRNMQLRAAQSWWNLIELYTAVSSQLDCGLMYCYPP